MTTSSARPDHLRRYAGEAVAATRSAERPVDATAVAINAHLAGGGRPGGTVAALGLARSALARVSRLADATARIADAFEAADRGPVTLVVTVTDRRLGRELAAVAAGVADDALLGPGRFAAGRRRAAALAELPLRARLEALAATAEDPTHGPAHAAGFLRELGPGGMIALVEEIRVAYEAGDLPRRRADRGLRALSSLLQTAGATLEPADSPAELASALRRGARAEDPYALDLGLIRALGASVSGRQALRQLLVGTLDAGGPAPGISPPDLPPQVAVVLARILAHPGMAVAERPSRGSLHLLDDRVGGADLDLGILTLLARDPLAAHGWEVGAPAGTSPVAAYLERAVPGQAEVLGAILAGAHATPVERGWAEPYAMPLLDGRPRPAVERTGSLALVLDAAGRASASPTLSRALAAVLAAHPDAARELAGDAGYDARRSRELIALFAVLAEDLPALRAAGSAALAAYRGEAERVLARTPPTTVDPNELLGSLADARGVSVALEEGARIAGRHHDAALAFGIAVVSLATQAGAGPAGVAIGGPGGAATAAAARSGATHGAAAATDRWVDTEDGREVAGARAAARAEPHLLALAMAEDPAWRELLVDPGRLAALDVIGSAADRRSFAAWVAEQDPRVATPLDELIRRAP